MKHVTFSADHRWTAQVVKHVSNLGNQHSSGPMIILLVLCACPSYGHIVGTVCLPLTTLFSLVDHINNGLAAVLGKRVIVDLIPNQTSRNHTWFTKSQKKEDKYANYYIWSDTKPNNWVSRNSGMLVLLTHSFFPSAFHLYFPHLYCALTCIQSTFLTCIFFSFFYQSCQVMAFLSPIMGMGGISILM